MGKEISTFGDIEIEKINFATIRLLFFFKKKKDVDIEKVFFLVKKTINTLLVTCVTIVKLSNYTRNTS